GGLRGGLCVGRSGLGGRATGECEEHVVEVWRMHGQAVDLDPRVVEPGEQGSQRPDARVAGHVEGQVTVAGRAFEDALGGGEADLVEELQSDVTAGDA